LNDTLMRFELSGYNVILRSDKNMSDAQYWKCELLGMRSGKPIIAGWGATPEEAARRAEIAQQSIEVGDWKGNGG
jgi:hypothetical protein